MCELDLEVEVALRSVASDEVSDSVQICTADLSQIYRSFLLRLSLDVAVESLIESYGVRRPLYRYLTDMCVHRVFVRYDAPLIVENA